MTHLACLLSMSAWIDMSETVMLRAAKLGIFFVWKQIQVGISAWVTKQGVVLGPAAYR